MLKLFSLTALAERLRRDDGQTIAECTIALAVLAIGILLAVTALSLGDPSSSSGAATAAAGLAGSATSP